MKKNIIIILSTITLIILGLLLRSYIVSFHDIKFIVGETNISIDIYSGKNKIKTITKNEVINLRNGSYSYKVIDNKFDSNSEYFYINKDSDSIVINPNYSTKYLSDLLLNEKNNILNIIKSKYPNIINNYNISKEQLFKKGEWFAAIIERKTKSTDDITDPYRIIMKKIDNKWTIIHYPEIVATKYNFKDVPDSIINLVNNL